MLLQEHAVSWDLRSLVYGPWAWIASLVVLVAVIGLAIYMKLQRSRRKFTVRSNDGKWGKGTIWRARAYLSLARGEWRTLFGITPEQKAVKT
jgi:hypothetical protein